MPTSSQAELWDTIARDAARESRLWADALRPPGEQELEAVFSPLSEPRFALGLETIYEGYLAHYGRPRLFAPADADAAILLGDYLYAHGLVRVASLGDVVAVSELASLISLCARLRGDGTDGDGAAWAATAALLGTGDERLQGALATLRDERDSDRLVELARAEAGDDTTARALAAHAGRVR